MASINDGLLMFGRTVPRKDRVQRRQHCVTITFDEAATVGLSVGSHPNNWGDKLRPLAVAKGVPEKKLYIGSMEVSCIDCDDGMDIEWDD